MKTWLLIGPSGVGKSVVGGLACDRTCMNFVSLDQLAVEFGIKQRIIESGQGIIPLLAKVGPHELLNVGRRALNEVRLSLGDERHLVCDVGAGFLLTDEAPGFVSSQPAVAMLASPAECYARSRKRGGEIRSLSDFEATEFCEARQVLYSIAAVRVDVTGLKTEEAASRLRSIFLDIASANLDIKHAGFRSRFFLICDWEPGRIRSRFLSCRRRSR